MNCACEQSAGEPGQEYQAMKSAYELAMERMEKEQGPTRSLTDAQKATLADIDNRFEAKEAETRVDFESRMAANPAEAAELKAAMMEALASLREKHEKEKAAVWDSAD